MSSVFRQICILIPFYKFKCFLSPTIFIAKNYSNIFTHKKNKTNLAVNQLLNTSKIHQSSHITLSPFFLVLFCAHNQQTLFLFRIQLDDLGAGAFSFGKFINFLFVAYGSQASIYTFSFASFGDVFCFGKGFTASRNFLLNFGAVEFSLMRRSRSNLSLKKYGTNYFPTKDNVDFFFKQNFKTLQFVDVWRCRN